MGVGIGSIPSDDSEVFAASEKCSGFIRPSSIVLSSTDPDVSYTVNSSDGIVIMEGSGSSGAC